MELSLQILAGLFLIQTLFFAALHHFGPKPVPVTKWTWLILPRVGLLCASLFVPWPLLAFYVLFENIFSLWYGAHHPLFPIPSAENDFHERYRKFFRRLSFLKVVLMGIALWQNWLWLVWAVPAISLYGLVRIIRDLR